MLSFVVAEALRDLRRTGRVGVSAVLLIALSLAALGGFWLFSLNLGKAVARWRDRVRVIVYLKEEPLPSKVEEVRRQIESVGGIQRTRYVSKNEALISLKQALGDQVGLAEQLPRNPLPASFEVTPDTSTATPDGTRALVSRLAALPGVDDVQGGAQWVQGLAQFQHLFEMVGLTVGAVLGMAAVLTVTTATTLVMHLRRDEMEIMRLVGAAESVVRLPRMLQGMIQGLLAAIIALGVLRAGYAVAAPRLEPLLPLTLGLERAIFFSPLEMLLLLAIGAALGAAGGLLARGRVHA
jgi:cell division transport system permease protein